MTGDRLSPLIDQYQRPISYLRLSATDRCDLRCAYCMPERMQFMPKKDLLSLEELEAVACAFIARGVDKIRLTGGEPLVRRDILKLVRALGAKLGYGLRELTLTTNGTQLADHAEDLFAAGVRRINVSLDTLDRATFARLARRDALSRVLDGIDAAQRAGIKVKINTVALKGINETELTHITAWAHERGCDLTLIEVMPLGDIDEDRIDHYLPLTSVWRSLEDRWTLMPSPHRTGGPARYFEVKQTGGRLGMITPLTGNFCESCNRVRVSATGQLYACLGGQEQVDLRAAMRGPDREALDAAMDEAMRIKPLRHAFVIDTRGHVQRCHGTCLRREAERLSLLSAQQRSDAADIATTPYRTSPGLPSSSQL